jgi:excisionase family DNA binding protein
MAPPDGFVSALERPLTIAEVAGHYRVSERTIRRRIKDGTLHKELGQGRLVRISVEQLRRLAEKPY